MAQPPNSTPCCGPPLRRRRRRPPDHLLDRRRKSSSSARRTAIWSGRSPRASSPPAMALRVVSAPAANNRLKNPYRPRSVQLRRLPSRVAAFATTESMSSAGAARLAATSSLAVGPHPRAWRPRCHIGPSGAAGTADVELCSTASKRKCRSYSGTPRRMQIICIGNSAATASRKSTALPAPPRIQQPTRPDAQVVLDQPDHPRREPRADQPPDRLVAGIVHHVQDLPPDGHVLEHRAAVLPGTARHRRIRLRIPDHLQAFRVRGHRPEPLAVGRVLGGFVPEDGRLPTMAGEQVVGESRRGSRPGR